MKSTYIITLLIIALAILPSIAPATDETEISALDNLSMDFVTAARLKEIVLAKQLLEKGADIDILDQAGWAALHWAVKNEDAEFTEYLIGKDAKIDIQGLYDLYTPLHITCKTNYQMNKNRIRMATALLAKGADVNSKDESGTTPLHMAVSRGLTELAIILIENGAEVNTETTYHKLTPLHEAASAGHTDLAKLLIAMSGDVKADGRNGWTPLHAAANVQTAAALIDAGADINAVSKKGLTPLSEAIARGEAELAEYLISKGADINHKLTSTDRTLLHYAGNAKVAELLVNHGLDPFKKDKWGYTPLHTSVLWEIKDVTQYLISKGANINAKITWFIRNDDTAIGSTPLDIALDHGPDNKLFMLFKEMNAKSGRYLPGQLYYEDLGETEIELFRAVRNGQLTKIKNRLRAGADINAVDNAGWTPLHWAAYFGRIWTVSYLVRNGADMNSRSSVRISRKYPKDQTVLDIAEASGKKEVVVKLIEMGAKRGKDLPSEKQLQNLIKGIKKITSDKE